MILRLLFLAAWVYVTGREVWEALEAGEPKKAVVPGAFLVFGVWAVLGKYRKKQEDGYGPAREKDEPWENPDWDENDWKGDV